MKKTILAWLEGDHLAPQLAVLAFILCVPGFGIGFQVDDYFHKVALSDPPILEDLSRDPSSLFVFFDGDPAKTHDAMHAGVAPWWTKEELRLAFYRPVSGFSMWLDHRLWPERPWLMHLHSALWYALAAFLATLFFRRILGPTWIAGFAALLFAVDEGHALPAVWLANRNATIALVFGLLTILAYDRWRQDSNRIAGVLAPILLLISLLCNEGGAAICAYLGAYVFFIDRDRGLRRMLAVVPCALVAIGWLLTYKAMGYGASYSTVYLDPSDPLRFMQAVAARAPILLAGQLGVSTDFHLGLSIPAHQVVYWFCVVALAVFAILMLRFVGNRSEHRFFGSAIALAVLPACSTFAAGRLLVFVSIAGAGLVALLVARISEAPKSCWARTVAGILLVVHLVIAPITFIVTPSAMAAVGEVILRAADSLPTDLTERDCLYAVNTPSAFLATYGPLVHTARHEKYPARLVVLGSGLHRTTVSVVDSRTLRIGPEGGYLAPRGTTGELRNDPINPLYAMQVFDHLYSDATPWHVGDQARLDGVLVEVSQVTVDGRPAEATFTFDDDLNQTHHRWVHWNNGTWERFELPQPGSTIVLAPVELPPPGH